MDKFYITDKLRILRNAAILIIIVMSLGLFVFKIDNIRSVSDIKGKDLKNTWVQLTPQEDYFYTAELDDWEIKIIKYENKNENICWQGIYGGIKQDLTFRSIGLSGDLVFHLDPQENAFWFMINNELIYMRPIDKA